MKTLVTYNKFFDIPKIAKEIGGYLPNFDRDRFIRAFEFAELAHRGQMRKDGTTPYICHPVEIIQILATLHADEDTLISALLHDVAEDTDFTIKDIEKAFGKKVAFLVDGVTKLSQMHFEQGMSDLQIESLRKLLLHSSRDVRVVVIKLADRLHNMSTLDNIIAEEKRVKKATETLEIYVPIADLLGLRKIKGELEDMCFKYIFPHEYEQMSKQIKDTDGNRKNYVKEFTKVIKTMGGVNKINVEVELKRKNLYAIYKKICSLGRSLGDIDDRVNLRVVVDTADDCYRMLGAVHMRFAPLTNKFKDYIANPKPNGYKSIHTTVFGIDGVLTEMQIMTHEMAMDADHGVTVNFFRNEQTVAQRAAWLKQVIELEQSSGSNASSFLESLKGDILQERILVLTPKGKTVNLPKNASVIDFAYAIHTNIGDHAWKAEINGEIKPISSILQTRDVVKVITSPESSPDLAWFSFTRTNYARKSIKMALRKASEESKVNRGKKILQKHVQIAGHSIGPGYKGILRQINKVMGLNLGTKNDLYVAIAQGDIAPSKVVSLLRQLRERFELHARRVNLKIKAVNRHGLLADISMLVNRYAEEVHSFTGVNTDGEKKAAFYIELSIKDPELIGDLFDDLAQIDGVEDVIRMSTRAFKATFVGMAWLWILLMLSVLFVSSQGSAYPQFVPYSLIGMSALQLYMHQFFLSKFPVLANKKRYWLAMLGWPLFSGTVMYSAAWLYEVNTSFWLVLLIVMAGVFAMGYGLVRRR